MVSAVHEPRGAPGASTSAATGEEIERGEVVDAYCPFCSALVAEQVELPWPQTPRRCRSCERWIGPRRAVEAPLADAHCPHCRSLVAAGVGLPWPPAPRRCRSCERWIGRNRAAEAPQPRLHSLTTHTKRLQPRHARARRESPPPQPEHEVRAPARARRKPKPSDTGTWASIRLYEVTLKACERVLGADHPHTLAARHDVAAAYAAAEDFATAIPLYEETLAKRAAVIGPDHPDTRASRRELASARESAATTADERIAGPRLLDP